MELSLVQKKEIDHAKRSNFVTRYILESIQAQAEAIAELVELVGRDKTLGEKLKGWLKL
jgi:hypothetical protein